MKRYALLIEGKFQGKDKYNSDRKRQVRRKNPGKRVEFIPASEYQPPKEEKE